MESVTQNIEPETARNARKKSYNSSHSKRNQQKRETYKPKSLPEFPTTCKHVAGSLKLFFCHNLTMKDIMNFHARFYKCTTKIDQDTFILKHLQSETPKRRRVLEDSQKNRSVSMKYFIVCQDTERKRICQKAFLEILGIRKDRVCNIGKKFHQNATLPKERRGGDHTSHKQLSKKKSVRRFIESLQCTESHYCRSQTQRKYLSCELSIKKIVEDVQRIDESGIVKECLDGFGSPLTDAYSTCLRFKERLKFITDPDQKNALLTEKKIHILKASAFYKMLKEQAPDVMIFSFDCKKNLPMPKIPDQKAYYSRQLYMYNFTIVQGTSKSPLTQNNVFIYAWFEIDRPKSSNEIVSAVFHRLNETTIPPCVKVVRLIADGCGGQNKNTTMLTMLLKWFITAPASVEAVEIIFPIVGHSFMPPDRVFGNIEKIVRSKDHIVGPNEYFDIFQQFGRVIKLTSVCEINDWREQAKKHVKLPGQWHFKFNVAKRIILSRGDKAGTILVRGEPNYMVNINSGKSVLKKSNKLSSIKPRVIPLGNYVKPEKFSDVEALLKAHYGDEWRNFINLSFYKNVLGIERNNSTEHYHDVDECCQLEQEYF